MAEKCIGECFKPGDNSLHPITLRINNNKETDNNLCIKDFRSDSFLICNDKNSIGTEDLEKMILTPEIKFNTKSFLDLYNITSFEAGTLWIKINIETKLYNTIDRILNAMWISYYSKLKKITDDIVNIYDALKSNYLSSSQIDKLTKKIIKKSIKKFLKKKHSWDDINFF